MRAIVSQITGVSIVCWAVCSGVYQIEYQSSASLVFVRGIHRLPVDSPHKGPVTRKNVSPIASAMAADNLVTQVIFRFHHQKGDGEGPTTHWFQEQVFPALCSYTR